MAGIEKVGLRFKGIARLLMHAPTTIDEHHELTIKLQTLTDKKKAIKNDRNMKRTLDEQLSRVEWEAGLWWSSTHGPIIPASAVLACLRDTARRSKQGKLIEGGIVCNASEFKLNYPGPRDMEGLWAADFKDRRAVGIGNKRIIRTRPLFPIGWYIDVELMLGSSVLNRKTLLQIADDAGGTGLGDYRQQFGKFEASEL